MVLSDFDQSRFFLYAGKVLELEDALAQAESPVELERHIKEWERSRRGGDEDGSVNSLHPGGGPRPRVGGAEADEGDA